MPDCKWLTPEHRLEIRKIFEPRYKRKLTETEVEEIAINLTNLLEIILKHRYSQKNKLEKTVVK